MFENEIPSHVQEEIMITLPVKSLIQFRSISKAWKSFIDNSDFIAAHSLRRHTQQQHLLVSHVYVSEVEDFFLYCQSYIDDDTFPQQRSVLTLPPPLHSPQQLIRPSVVNTSHGLVCICGLHPSFQTDMILLWNPWIRKYIAVIAPAILSGLGFAVCPVTNDPKMVSIEQSSSWDASGTSYRFEIMVYKLSSGEWRSLSNNLPTERIQDWSSMVVTDRFFYWHADLPTHNMIMSFNVTDENFQVTDLPHSLAHHEPGDLHITKHRESLAILQSGINRISTVWMMEDGVQRSFTKLFTINTTYELTGFRKSGVPIMKVKDDDVYESKLVVYEPNSEHNNVIGISGYLFSFDVNSYMETLLLLDRSECISY